MRKLWGNSLPVEVKGQLPGVSSLLAWCGSRGLNSGSGWQGALVCRASLRFIVSDFLSVSQNTLLRATWLQRPYASGGVPVWASLLRAAGTSARNKRKVLKPPWTWSSACEESAQAVGLPWNTCRTAPLNSETNAGISVANLGIDELCLHSVSFSLWQRVTLSPGLGWINPVFRMLCSWAAALTPMMP